METGVQWQRTFGHVMTEEMMPKPRLVLEPQRTDKHSPSSRQKVTERDAAGAQILHVVVLSCFDPIAIVFLIVLMSGIVFQK